MALSGRKMVARDLILRGWDELLLVRAFVRSGPSRYVIEGCRNGLLGSADFGSTASRTHGFLHVQPVTNDYRSQVDGARLGGRQPD
jgi:hypothetical protein